MTASTAVLAAHAASATNNEFVASEGRAITAPEIQMRACSAVHNMPNVCCNCNSMVTVHGSMYYPAVVTACAGICVRRMHSRMVKLCNMVVLQVSL
jgi:hypothetical protein